MKQHLAELDQHIQDMLTLRRELTHRYEHIEAVISDSIEALDETVCNGKVCGLIEQDNEQNEPQK
ncbi:hypothetical protein XM38_008320 [Halomicronema hongdechloris C2206]|uniref:Uncharacterized protein n=1 Tax=Halomicronema hongdechloris C2206 TaxID=1641165 RepID=A0A1Z3HHV3_9CYAN|nr:hypothetical protein [Halomicronema hongdechloris]ASC69902.1 hypothetical protein XM38_008320 [Halomicronema hongdechloris C2206]